MKARVFPGLESIETVDGVLRGRRIGLLTNPTGINRDLVSSVDLLHARYGLSALFGPEHGVRGAAQAGDHVDTAIDPDTGVTAYSLFGATREMTDDMLAAFDVLVYDIQDVGARFYTYLYSLAYAMRSCAKAGKPVVVLDRIDPVGGVRREGTVVEPVCASFVGDYGLPTRYGLTVGEFALYVKDYLKLDLDLTVVPLQGWERRMLLDDTDLPWVAPSPNCMTLASMLCFLGTCVFEGTNLSEGRGTTQPFELIGAPWIDGGKLERRMNDMRLPGVRFRRASFQPSFSKHAGALCHGVQMHVTDRDAYRPFDSGLYLLDVVRDMYPNEFEFIKWSAAAAPAIDRLLGTDAYRTGKLSARGLIEAHQPLVAAFSERARAFELYA